MKKELKDKWIQALLSGEYIQGTGSLRREKGGKDCFCALGVLCDIFDPNRWELRDDDPYWSWADATCVLGLECQEEMGLSIAEHEAIYIVNDREKRSFKEIADWIEKNVPAI